VLFTTLQRWSRDQSVAYEKRRRELEKIEATRGLPAVSSQARSIVTDNTSDSTKSSTDR
jgi:hypothetical protein